MASKPSRGLPQEEDQPKLQSKINHTGGFTTKSLATDATVAIVAHMQDNISADEVTKAIAKASARVKAAETDVSTPAPMTLEDQLALDFDEQFQKTGYRITTPQQTSVYKFPPAVIRALTQVLSEANPTVKTFKPLQIELRKLSQNKARRVTAQMSKHIFSGTLDTKLKMPTVRQERLTALFIKSFGVTRVTANQLIDIAYTDLPIPKGLKIKNIQGMVHHTVGALPDERIQALKKGGYLPQKIDGYTVSQYINQTTEGSPTQEFYLALLKKADIEVSFEDNQNAHLAYGFKGVYKALELTKKPHELVATIARGLSEQAHNGVKLSTMLSFAANLPPELRPQVENEVLAQAKMLADTHQQSEETTQNLIYELINCATHDYTGPSPEKSITAKVVKLAPPSIAQATLLQFFKQVQFHNAPEAALRLRAGGITIKIPNNTSLEDLRRAFPKKVVASLSVDERQHILAATKVAMNAQLELLKKQASKAR